MDAVGLFAHVLGPNISKWNISFAFEPHVKATKGDMGKLWNIFNYYTSIKYKYVKIYPKEIILNV